MGKCGIILTDNMNSKMFSKLSQENYYIDIIYDCYEYSDVFCNDIHVLGLVLGGRNLCGF